MNQLCANRAFPRHRSRFLCGYRLGVVESVSNREGGGNGLATTMFIL